MTTSRAVVGAVIILIGLGFLFDLNVFRLLIPLIIIFIGVRILMGRDEHWARYQRSVAKENVLRRVLVFSGLNQKITSEKFESAELVAIFGAGELDLSEVKPKSKAVKLSLVAIFGGLKVKVPESWSVSSEGAGVLGAFSNKTTGGKEIACKLEGAAIFGSVEVIN